MMLHVSLDGSLWDNCLLLDLSVLSAWKANIGILEYMNIKVTCRNREQSTNGWGNIVNTWVVKGHKLK